MATPGQLRILQAIETLLSVGLAGMAGVEFARNDFSLADPGAAARVNMFDGDPGQPVEELLGGPKTYRHEIPLEIVPRQSAADEEAHGIHDEIKNLIKADRFLGGLVDWLDITELGSVPVPISETKALLTASASLIAEYTL